MTLYAVFVFVFGGLLVVIAAIAEEKKWKTPIIFHVLRDIGIAFIVAVVITGVFELYERTQQNVASMEREIDARMGDQLTPEVWKDVKEQILDKHLLRRNAEMRVRFEKSEGLLADQRLVHVEFTYDLYNISSPETAIKVRHSLVSPEDAKSRIPRFEATSVERGVTFTPNMLDEASKKGFEELNLHIERNQRVHLITRRVELANVRVRITCT